MSAFFADILIWFLLVAGIGFGVLAFFGLLIFPDIRSRRFTVSRAALISMSLLLGAVLVFGIYQYLAGSPGDPGLVVRTISVWMLLSLTTILISRHILILVKREESDTHARG